MRLHLIQRWLTWLSAGALLLYLLDRFLKAAAVVHFFRQPAPPAYSPTTWPTVALLHPITRGSPELRRVLEHRSQQIYPGHIHHLLICDRADAGAQAVCRTWLATHPEVSGALVLVENGTNGIASKIEKLQAGLPLAQADLLCFVDDDVLLRPDAIAQVAVHLRRTGAGAAFGLACYTNWDNVPSSLMSAFVNSNALLSYIPLTYLTAPYTITGHFFAIPAPVFAAAGGLDGMTEGRIDDDHELARRIRRLGYHCVQTPAIYDVDNHLPTLQAYINQMQRWFTIPRLTMLPELNRREQFVSLVGSIGNLLLPMLVLLAAITRGATARKACWGALLAFMGVYLAGERRYLRQVTPIKRLPLVLIAGLFAPLQALAALAGGNVFTWRGQRLRLHPGGRAEILSSEPR